MGRQPSEALVARLTGQALKIQGYFNPQNVAMMLWSFSTLGLQPDESLAKGWSSLQQGPQHIQLSKDLQVAAKAGDSELHCALVLARWQDFDAVNAATAYQKLLLMRTARDTHRQQDAVHARQSERDRVLGVLEPGLYRQHIHTYPCLVRDSVQTRYGVATISRLLKIIGLFCKRAL